MMIGLTGRPAAGKDTVGEMLERAGWRGIAFADSLRIECAQAWGVDIRTFTDRVGKESVRQRLAAGYAHNPDWLRYVAVQGWSLYDPRSPRWVLQTWGEWRCIADPAYWIRQVHEWRRTELARGHRDLVVTDVRKPLERDAIHGWGGKVVRVHRPGLPAMDAATAAHVTERHVELQADADIHNDGTLADLQAEVQRVLLQLQETTA